LHSRGTEFEEKKMHQVKSKKEKEIEKDGGGRKVR
jgi:hypothetical protein